MRDWGLGFGRTVAGFWFRVSNVRETGAFTDTPELESSGLRNSDPSRSLRPETIPETGQTQFSVRSGLQLLGSGIDIDEGLVATRWYDVAMSRVGIRDLKNRLSRYLEDVEKGERISVTRRGKVIAYLVPVAESGEAVRLAGMVQEGLATWSGGKPKGSSRPIRAKGKAVSEVVLEDRD